jgi:hypothetical protein
MAALRAAGGRRFARAHKPRVTPVRLVCAGEPPATRRPNGRRHQVSWIRLQEPFVLLVFFVFVVTSRRRT